MGRNLAITGEYSRLANMKSMRFALRHAVADAQALVPFQWVNSGIHK
jgi:hypothetical protein